MGPPIYLTMASGPNSRYLTVFTSMGLLSHGISRYLTVFTSMGLLSHGISRYQFGGSSGYFLYILWFSIVFRCFGGPHGASGVSGAAWGLWGHLGLS